MYHDYSSLVWYICSRSIGNDTILQGSEKYTPKNRKVQQNQNSKERRKKSRLEKIKKSQKILKSKDEIQQSTFD